MTKIVDLYSTQAPFQRLVREITQGLPKENDLRWRPSAIEALQASTHSSFLFSTCARHLALAFLKK